MQPVLWHFNPHFLCILTTNASNFTILGILEQADENDCLHPVAFYSWKLLPQEINYDVHDKELLAIIKNFHDMHAWLVSSPFPISVACDYKNLQYFMTSQILNYHQAWWATFLADFDFCLNWKPGNTNIANAASRRPDYKPQNRDPQLEAQQHTILTPTHTKRLYSNGPANPPSLSSFITLTVNNLELLEQFKTAMKNDDK